MSLYTYEMAEDVELIARAEALSHLRIECEDETGEKWTTSIGEWLRDNAECVGDDELYSLVHCDSTIAWSNCGPFQIRRLDP